MAYSSKTRSETFLNHLNGINSLTIYRSIINRPPVKAWKTVIEAFAEQDLDLKKCIDSYSDFLSIVFENNRFGNWGHLLIRYILTDKNPFTEYCGSYIFSKKEDKKLPSMLQAAVKHDLNIIFETSQIQPIQFINILKRECELQNMSNLTPLVNKLPQWEFIAPMKSYETAGNLKAVRSNKSLENPIFNSIEKEFKKQLISGETWSIRIDDLIQFHLNQGYGSFSESIEFEWNYDQLTSLYYQSPVFLNDLYDYQDITEELMAPIDFFIKGYSPCNTLLLGPKGTGKTAFVKAVAYHYAPRGARIIHVKNNNYDSLTKLFEEIEKTSLHFLILFDDFDLSNSNHNAQNLQHILSAGIGLQPNNCVILVASSSEHNVSHADFLEDKQSISNWKSLFPIVISLEYLDERQYLNLIFFLANKLNLNIGKDKLKMLALNFAKHTNELTPRAATMFIQNLVAHQRQS